MRVGLSPAASFPTAEGDLPVDGDFPVVGGLPVDWGSMGSVGGGFGRATQFDLPDSAEPLTAVTQKS
uniref:Uncharacterized protein n=1 Tax=Streptomyces sp. NBC_00180 TaxID=2903632 RepID=A0AAU1IBK8_9ACTN